MNERKSNFLSIIENQIIVNSLLIIHAQKARKEHTDSTLNEAAIALGYLSSEEFDTIVVPEKMVGGL